jgi:DNA-binding PadR family transcriptional regulator
VAATVKAVAVAAVAGVDRGGAKPAAARNRGDVRTAVLLLLAEEPMHGYQLMQTIGERTNGRWAPSPGAIYPTLSQLEDEGLVVVQKDGGRKLASLTETGTTLVSEQKGSWNSPFGDQDQEAEIPDLRVALHDLGGAIREVQRS